MLKAIIQNTTKPQVAKSSD